MPYYAHFVDHAIGLDERKAANNGQEREREVDKALGSTGQHCDSVVIDDDAPEDRGNTPGKKYVNECRRQKKEINECVSGSGPYRRVFRARAGKNGGQPPKGRAAKNGRGDGRDVEQGEAKSLEHDGVLSVSVRAEGFRKAAES